MRALLSHPRAGLTLLELLVVLVILTIAAAVVPLAWRPSRADDGNALDVLTQRARREAIRRGEGLRLRVDTDGAWVLAARDGSDVLETGRIVPPAAAVSLRLDALGTCQPGSAPPMADLAAAAVTGATASFDMLGCRYLPTLAATAGVVP